MTTTTQISGAPADAPDLLVETRRAIAWDAVIAGALIGLAVTICLSLAGAALGFGLIDPYEGASAKSIGVGALIWLFIVNIVGMGIGGYVAGRGGLNETTMDVADYRYRSAAHGLTVWAIATVAAGVLGVSGVTSIVGAATQTAALTAGAAGGGAAAALMGDEDGDIAFHVRQLFGPQKAPGQGQSTQQAAAPAAVPAPGAPSAAASPSQDYGDDAMDEAGNILNRAWLRNGLAPTEKTYLAGVLARHAGISQADAEQKVGEAEQRLKTAKTQMEAQAKEAADKAAKASALATLFAFLAIAIGGVAAVAGALSCNTRITRRTTTVAYR